MMHQSRLLWIAASVLLVMVALSSSVYGVSRIPRWDQLDTYTFDQWQRDFARFYENEEERQYRRSVFEQRLDRIRVHNRQASVSWRMGVNHMTDRTDDERRSMMGYHKSIGFTRRQMFERQNQLSHQLASLSAPSSIDWRKFGAVTDVKDQGQCGSCWSFSSAETLESMTFLATGQLPVLSMQHILSCTPNVLACGGNGGCEGGTAELAFSTLLSTGSGIASEWVYPYISYRGTDYPCNYTWGKTPTVVTVTGVVKLPTNDYQSLLNAVGNVGPVSIAVDASAWHDYSEGVFTGCNKTNLDINHVVQLVGYGTDTQYGDYWLVRNSWAPTWGEIGYIRLARSSNASCAIDNSPQDGQTCAGGPSSVTTCGECGVLYDACYPIVPGLKRPGQH